MFLQPYGNKLQYVCPFLFHGCFLDICDGHDVQGDTHLGQDISHHQYSTILTLAGVTSCPSLPMGGKLGLYCICCGNSTREQSLSSSSSLQSLIPSHLDSSLTQAPSPQVNSESEQLKYQWNILHYQVFSLPWQQETLFYFFRSTNTCWDLPRLSSYRPDIGTIVGGQHLLCGDVLDGPGVAAGAENDLWFPVTFPVWPSINI